jgi:hypothetical protein
VQSRRGCILNGGNEMEIHFLILGRSYFKYKLGKKDKLPYCNTLREYTNELSFCGTKFAELNKMNSDVVILRSKEF